MRQPNQALAEARAAGLKFFMTGQPCKFGHVSPRYVSNSVCVACAAEKRERANARKAKRAAERLRWPSNRAQADSADDDIITAWRRTHELTTWGGSYPALMAAKWRGRVA